MRHRNMWVFPCVLCFLVFAGCIPGKPDEAKTITPDEATSEQLVQEWIRLAENADEFIQSDRHVIIGRELASRGENSLSPLLEVMADPASDDTTRLLTVQSIVGHVTPDYMPMLKPMMESETPTVRSCAITLIGHIPSPEAQGILEKALEDPDERVSFSALSGLAIQGDGPARVKMSGVYFEEDASENRRREVLRVILWEPETGDIEILADAINQEFVTDYMRTIIASTLGRIGDASVLGALEQSGATFTDPTFQDTLNLAITAVKEREGASTPTDA